MLKIADCFFYLKLEGLTLKATDENSHLIAISVVRPGCATTPHPIFPIGQATKKPAHRRVAGKGEGGKDDAILFLTPTSHSFLWASGGSHFTGAEYICFVFTILGKFQPKVSKAEINFIK